MIEICEPRLRNPRDSNKNLSISAGARVGRSVSGRSKFRRSSSNNRARRRCDRVGGRARWRHVSIISNRPVRRNSRTNGIRRLWSFELLYCILSLLLRVANTQRGPAGGFSRCAVIGKRAGKSGTTDG